MFVQSSDRWRNLGNEKESSYHGFGDTSCRPAYCTSSWSSSGGARDYPCTTIHGQPPALHSASEYAPQLGLSHAHRAAREHVELQYKVGIQTCACFRHGITEGLALKGRAPSRPQVGERYGTGFGDRYFVLFWVLALTSIRFFLCKRTSRVARSCHSLRLAHRNMQAPMRVGACSHFLASRRLDGRATAEGVQAAGCESVSRRPPVRPITAP